jgi:hypothetical protein
MKALKTGDYEKHLNAESVILLETLQQYGEDIHFTKIHVSDLRRS